MHVCIVAIGRERTSASTCHSLLCLFLSHRFSIGEEVEATTYDACMQSVINGRLFYVLICFVFGLHSWCFNATVAASLSCVIFFVLRLSLFFDFHLHVAVSFAMVFFCFVLALCKMSNWFSSPLPHKISHLCSTIYWRFSHFLVT